MHFNSIIALKNSLILLGILNKNTWKIRKFSGIFLQDSSTSRNTLTAKLILSLRINLMCYFNTLLFFNII